MGEQRQDFFEGFMAAALLFGNSRLEEQDARQNRAIYGTHHGQPHSGRPLPPPAVTLSAEDFLAIPTYIRQGKAISA